MILISAFYAVSDFPMNVYYLLLNIHSSLTLLQSGYYAVLFLSFLYICTNPFVYAAKFEPVRRVLLRLVPCRKQGRESGQITNSGVDPLRIIYVGLKTLRLAATVQTSNLS